ncbi:MAG TPA: hypothetical protein VK934_04285, partial [Fimbriimonas sp.]|nr:hypothetical protein [Fimbriimonas sp.]
PVRDRMLLPTADGGRCVTDALREAQIICNHTRRLRGEEAHPYPRFNFAIPGSLQGFACEEFGTLSNEAGTLAITTVESAFATTPTFISPEQASLGGYELVASPAIYPGQTLRAQFRTPPTTFRLVVGIWSENDQIDYHFGPSNATEWQVPNDYGFPIAEVGVDVHCSCELASLSWHGEPTVKFISGMSQAWRKQWVNGVDEWAPWGSNFRLIQNEGTGLLITGTREWKDITVKSSITPNLAERFGIACRVQGMRRFYALLLCRDSFVRLVKALDGETVLAEQPYDRDLNMEYDFEMSACGSKIECSLDGQHLFTVEDIDRPLIGGGIAYVITEGRIDSDEISVAPAGPK